MYDIFFCNFLLFYLHVFQIQISILARALTLFHKKKLAGKKKVGYKRALSRISVLV